ncbi:alanine racemase [Thermodesulfobacteriota bacterium]
MRERYERPTIVKHVSGLANKFGRAKAANHQPDIDGIRVADLAEEYGSPLFVFSERSIRHMYKDALRSFEVRYPNVQFAWSYKTNYLDAVCKVFHSEGTWAEVVSEHEYEMARRLGIPGESVIFNGPFKSADALERAARENAKIHLDHHEEIRALEAVADRLGKTIDVGLRLNMDTGIVPSWDRFGFNFDNGEAWHAARRIQVGSKLRLNAVHAHIGTFVLEPSAYNVQAGKLATFAKRVESELGFKIDYIDLGGGFPSKNTLQGQYYPGETSNPSIDTYAEAATSALLDAGLDKDDPPTLVLETGRALVDEAGYLVTSVVGQKRLPSDLRALIVDAGVNILLTAFWYNHEILPVQDHGGLMEETIVYGPLCMNIDVVRSSVYLPVMETGDLLVIRPVGAYNVTQWMQFIRMRPPVVMIGEDGKVETIRLPETVETLKELERIPSWMK